MNTTNQPAPLSLDAFELTIKTLAAIQAAHERYCAANGFTSSATYGAELGKRYVRLLDVRNSGRACLGWIDTTTGDLLKSKSFKGPAKGVRGSAVRGDFKCCGPFGIR